DFCCIGRAHECRVVVGKRHVLDAAVHRARRDGSDVRDDVRARDGAPFRTLYAEADDNRSHTNWMRFSTALILSRTCAGVTGVLPSCSQATPAAIDARTEAITERPAA